MIRARNRDIGGRGRDCDRNRVRDRVRVEFDETN